MMEQLKDQMMEHSMVAYTDSHNLFQNKKFDRSIGQILHKHVYNLACYRNFLVDMVPNWCR